MPLPSDVPVFDVPDVDAPGGMAPGELVVTRIPGQEGVRMQSPADVAKAGGPGLAAEVLARTRGDDLQSVEIHSLQALTQALDSQATADTALELVFRTTIVTAAGTFSDGDIAFVAPRSRAIESRFRIATPADLTTEVKARQAGDVIFRRAFNNAGGLGGALRQHAASDHASLFECSGYFTTATRTYQAGQKFYLAPDQLSEGDLDLISEIRYLGLMAITPGNIPAAGDLDGDYQLTLSDIQTDLLKAWGVNQLEVWVGAEAVHQFPWAPAETFVGQINISTAEETQIGAPSGGNYRVLAVFRKDGTYVAEIGTLLTVGGAHAAGLTVQEQIALLNILPSPAIIPFADAAALSVAVRRMRLAVTNPELLTGDVWAEVWLQGQRGTLHLADGTQAARVKWARSLSALDARFAENIADAISAGIADDAQAELRIRFYDKAAGGNELERSGVNIPILSTA